MSVEKLGLTAIIGIALIAAAKMILDVAVESVTADILIGDGNPIEKEGYSIVE
ncbi:hypothetical protein [Sporosarcina sp. NPDC096371]|uniref:hypothetical protein n=1 Tax=Sporosarcina sp. NPDC096371 TaxID=3364530 RepID=UPI003811860A